MQQTLLVFMMNFLLVRSAVITCLCGIDGHILHIYSWQLHISAIFSFQNLYYFVLLRYLKYLCIQALMHCPLIVADRNCLVAG